MYVQECFAVEGTRYIDMLSRGGAITHGSSMVRPC